MQRVCVACSGRFFADEIDCINGHWVCTYDMAKVVVCAICGKLILGQRDAKKQIGWCSTCSQEYSVFPNLFLTLRFITFNRDCFTCRYCGRSPISDASVMLHVDHILPRSKGGENILSNFVTSCKECNIGKRDILLDEFQMKQLELRRNYESGTQIAKSRIEQVEHRKTNGSVLADSSSLGQGVGETIPKILGEVAKVVRKCKTCRKQFEPTRTFQRYCGLGLSCKKVKS